MYKFKNTTDFTTQVESELSSRIRAEMTAAWEAQVAADRTAKVKESHRQFVRTYHPDRWMGHPAQVEIAQLCSTVNGAAEEGDFRLIATCLNEASRLVA